MYNRFLTFLFVCAFVAVAAMQGQPSAPIGGGAEEIRAAKVKNTVTMTVDGQITPLRDDAIVPKKAKIITALGASVVLAFSNGATLLVESDSELIIEEYLQDPFSSPVKVATMVAEPSRSTTRLALNRGELIGEVKKLDHANGSTFRVQTPVGAAGIRGTLFRIVFRPGGTGQAFFTLSTSVGNVAFEPGSGGPPAGGGPPGQQPTVTGEGVVSGISVPQGQEISIMVDVTTNAQGQMVVTVLPPPPTQTTGISALTLQAVTSAASDIAVAVQTAVFTSPPPPPPPPNQGAPQPTTTTQTVTGPNFTAEITTTTPPATPPRIIPTNP